MKNVQDFGATAQHRFIYLRNPHRDGQVLSYLYHVKELSQHQIGDLLDVHQVTVCEWMKKNGLPARDSAEGVRLRGDHIAETNRKPRATYHGDGGGHWYWSAKNPDGSRSYVGIHQLTAIAEGAEPADVFAEENHVHHRDAIPWDNRPSNVEVVDRGDHVRIHARSAWEYSEALGCDVLVSSEAAEATDGGASA